LDAENKKDLFNRLLAEHGDRIYAFAYSLAGNEADASDLVAEAFARALQAFDRYDETRPFQSWVFKILQNVFVDSTRERGRVSSLDVEFEGEENQAPSVAERLVSAEPGPDDSPAREETRKKVREAMRKLPAEFRAPMALCDMSGLSYEEISKVLDVPVGTVRSRIFRGRKMFRELLDSYFKEGGSV
jgi:RNA polymerase sigma-70 factor (ECF subfamily)